MSRHRLILLSAAFTLSAAGAAQAQGAGSIQATVTVVDVQRSAGATGSAVQFASSLERTGSARRDLVNATLLAEEPVDARGPAHPAEPPRMSSAPPAIAPEPYRLVSVIYW
ncbi:MAG: hypothetical protein ABI637_02380 [Gemmatimonadota bacterium]